MRKSGFPKMRHYVGFWQIGSQILFSEYLTVEQTFGNVSTQKLPCIWYKQLEIIAFVSNSSISFQCSISPFIPVIPDNLIYVTVH